MLLAARVAAEAPPAGRDDLLAPALPDLPAWWAELGRPGYFPEAWWNAAYPWSLAGHVRGAFAASDPFLLDLGPPPGLPGVHAPIAWFDSVAVRAGGRGSWSGFESSIVEVRGIALPPRADRARRRARADLVVVGGSSAYDENALALTRADSVHAVTIGMASGGRGGIGGLGDEGRHHYEAQAWWRRGRHRVLGGVTHRGSAAALALGAEQDAGGLAGRLGYGLGLGRYELALQIGRAYDHHESFGLFLPYSRRDSDGLEAEAVLRGDGRPWSARVLATDERVRRFTPFDTTLESSARSIWVALGFESARGPARFTAGVGVGRDGGTRRTEFAPTVGFAFAEGPYAGRLFFERAMTAVWSDLAPGEDPFLQSTWLGGFDLSAGGPRGLAAAIDWVMGRTEDRAVAARYPFEELWMRIGYRRDPDPWDFGLGTVRAHWRGRSLRVGMEGFQLVRETHTIQPAVDPRRGGRATVEGWFTAFEGDLGVRLSGEVEGISGRESESGVRWLPGYVTFGAGASMTLADATVAFRIRNIENELRPLTWVDPATGVEALGPGLELRLLFAWRLYN